MRTVEIVTERVEREIEEAVRAGATLQAIMVEKTDRPSVRSDKILRALIQREGVQYEIIRKRREEI